jgi:hypothetical protein
MNGRNLGVRAADPVFDVAACVAAVRAAGGFPILSEDGDRFRITWGRGATSFSTPPSAPTVAGCLTS